MEVAEPHEAETAAARRERTHWPRRQAGSRLLGKCEPFHHPRFKLSHDDVVFAIGSCFARNIEEYLGRAGVTVASADFPHPFPEVGDPTRRSGLFVKYTPGAIHFEVAYALTDEFRHEPADYVVACNASGGFKDIHLPLAAPPASFERVVERRLQIRDIFGSIARSDVLVITLGLVEHWFDNKLGVYMNQNPGPLVQSRYPGRFSFKRLGYAENYALVQRTIEIIHSANRDANIVLTTSPVPLSHTEMASDVIVANAYSKSVLRVVAEEISEQFSFVDYFPSYEMVTLSSQDLAWSDDLRHVRDSMVGAVMQKFFNSYFAAEDAAATAAAYADATAKLERHEYEAAHASFLGLEDQFADDARFWTAFADAATGANLLAEAERITTILAERFPSPWARMQRGRAKLLNGDAAGALSLFQQAREWSERVAYQAGGWEMEAARLLNDRDAELAGAMAVADAIANEWSSPMKKRWIAKRMKKVLFREGMTDQLERVAPFFEKAGASLQSL